MQYVSVGLRRDRAVVSVTNVSFEHQRTLFEGSSSIVK